MTYGECFSVCDIQNGTQFQLCSLMASVEMSACSSLSCSLVENQYNQYKVTSPKLCLFHLSGRVCICKLWVFVIYWTLATTTVIPAATVYFPLHSILTFIRPFISGHDGRCTCNTAGCSNGNVGGSVGRAVVLQPKGQRFVSQSPRSYT